MWGLGISGRLPSRGKDIITGTSSFLFFFKILTPYKFSWEKRIVVLTSLVPDL